MYNENVNGSNFTKIIHSDTYPVINLRTKCSHDGRALSITGGYRGIGKPIAISFARAGDSFIRLGMSKGFENVKSEIESAAKESWGAISKGAVPIKSVAEALLKYKSRLPRGGWTSW